MANRSGISQGFLTRLSRHQGGNTLAIVAAAMLPLTAMIGAGVDMSRAYMAKARLQQACDAAALAGRRAMEGSSMSDSDKAEAQKFFDFNFPQGSFGTEVFEPDIDSKAGETTTVTVSANTAIPTAVMKIFGYNELPLNVSCDAKFDVGNTDVMLVLDVTGSMSGSIDDGEEGTTTRMAALQQAVRDFYDVLGAGNENTGRIRYGFVPYSSNVNVGDLIPTEFMIGGSTGDTWTYQSRLPVYYYPATPTTSTCYKIYNKSTCYTSASDANNASGTTNLSANNCTKYGNNRYPSNGSNPSTSGTAPSTTTSTSYTYAMFNGSTSAPSGSTDKKCVRKEVTTTTTYTTTTTAGSNTTFYQWRYTSMAYDVTQYITGNAITNPAYIDGTQSTWAGCIEEADTDSTITSTSSLTIPDAALDLDIDLIPDTDEERWRPYWPDVSWYRLSTPATSPSSPSSSSTNWSSNYGACPIAARHLAQYATRDSSPSETAYSSLSTFNSYIDSLSPTGYTNHGIGLLWGARLMSPDGIFANLNGEAPNGFAIQRHLIFMTDGQMNIQEKNYDAWGINKIDGRITSTSANATTLTSINRRRFEMICNAVKGKGITIWVVIFGDAPDDEVVSCASSTGHKFESDTAASLSSNFKTIAQNIGGLRLSQ